MRLDKFLADCGAGTRKEVKAIIRAGRVSINGKIATDAGINVDADTVVFLDGTPLAYRKYVYLMMNKPAGVVSANSDSRLPTVFDLVDNCYRRFQLSCVGRLDRDTTGLLLLTNDGAMVHALISPKRCVPKEYLAQIEGRVTQEDVEKFAEGLVIDTGYRCLPGELQILKSGEVSEISLTIYEGKFHQVKRMFQAVGKRVLSLHRSKLGGLTLDASLTEGQYRELSELEVQVLKKQVCSNLLQ